VSGGLNELIDKLQKPYHEVGHDKSSVHVVAAAATIAIPNAAFMLTSAPSQKAIEATAGCKNYSRMHGFKPNAALQSECSILLVANCDRPMSFPEGS
jgi:hypothetical protein